MHRPISRRDFLNGASVAIGASLLPTTLSGQDAGRQGMAGYYPPGLTGMRGSHPGSFEVAHGMRDGSRWDAADSGEKYDLVVVGGGISGLAAAWYFRQSAGPGARILVLDNHDDFGGHAKRNEFEIGNRTVIGYGGTMLIEAPATYPPVAAALIRDLGIDTERFYTAFDRQLYSGLGLKEGTFFDQETFGTDHLAVGDLGASSVLQDVPLSARARKDLLRLLKDDRHYLDEVPKNKRLDYLLGITYQDYLKKHVGIGEEALKVLDSMPRGVWAIGIDALPASTAWSSGYPGFADLDVGVVSYESASQEPNIFHFPDGNATVARLLVRKLIPDSAPGNDMEDIVTARFDYGALDQDDAPVRIRLNSTAVRVKHENDSPNSPVQVSYVRDGEALRVTAGRVVLACYHGVIPHLCPELPAGQRGALNNSVRAPLVYTNVLIRNWRSFTKLGVHRVQCPGSYHQRVALDYPVSIGDYRFAKSPDDPIVLHLLRVPGKAGATAREQFQAGKRDLLATGFETFERNVRDQLGRLLGPGGFDPARDIAAITVNRWPHGYAYGYDPETDQIAFEPSRWPDSRKHWIKARRRFGNIAIAATDSASNAMTESAIEEAHRAVSELEHGS